MSLLTVAQKNDLSAQLPKEVKYDPTEVVDPTYGINMYEKLNMMLVGDSIRTCKGYACGGWVEDFYMTDQLLHKGFYVDGQLKIYKNYYPDGTLEREYKFQDAYRSVMKKYYPDGTLKSEVYYNEKAAMKWTDYYPSGAVKYSEEYNKGMLYFINQESYHSNGNPRMKLELDNKKKLIYNKSEYFENGQVKESGQMFFNMDMFDYQKTGKWLVYNESGKLIKEQIYKLGKVSKETTF